MDDEKIARKYLNKINNARDKGIQFGLLFHEFKRVVTAKKCRYTGILLTIQTGAVPRDTDVTIDRIDNSIGYVTGNVVACCHAYNSFKGTIENPNNPITFKNLAQALKVQDKLIEKASKS